MEERRKFSLEELKSYNGENGRPAYIAYNGRVIDVTASKMWRGGMHMKRHAAGQDLTEEMREAPHEVDVLDRYPQVGELSAPESSRYEQPSPGTVPEWLERFLARHPFFLRHPHPMTVHFPIALMIGAPVFTLLFLLTGVPGFETTALNCLGGALLFCLVVIPTGLFTWWVYYQTRPMKAVTIKIVVSLAMFADGLAAFIWRLSDPQVTRQVSGVNILYLVLVCLLLPMVLVVAWYGATLTFPLRRERAEPPRGSVTG
jgi:predicted heme/steroid binding protein/uncharacterized membrane protein